MKIRFAVLSMALLSSLALAGCSNTVDGMGRDLENAGQGIQRTF